MKYASLLVLGLFMSAALAQGTGGASGGVTGGMSDASPTVLETINALGDGLTSLPLDQAISNIEGWQARLENSNDPTLITVAESLETLKGELQAQSVDQTSVGLLLIELGGRTQEAASMGQGDEAAQLVSLGMLLTDAGDSLTRGDIENVSGGTMSGNMTGGGMSGGAVTGGN